MESSSASARKKLCFVSTTRADWGLLRPLAAAMRRRSGFEVQIVVSNMHLSERFGMTVGEIEADGFCADMCVHLPEGEDSGYGRAVAMGECLRGMADAFERLRPDAVVCLGDRYEMLAVASAAAVMRIPVIHIAGGEISEGALDDSFRHAISKLASLHLTATEDYRRRVVQLGEEPASVINTGAIGVYNAITINPMSKAELEKSLEFSLDGPLAIVTYHPATAGTIEPHSELTRRMLAALDAVPELRMIITYPNNDEGGASAIPVIEEFGAARPGRVLVIPSLGARRYLSLLRVVDVVIGNSSSGIVEVPSAGIPTVDIGERQRGRMAAGSVIHCAADTDSIRFAVEKALSPEFRRLARHCENPYGREGTLEAMCEAITHFMKAPHRAKKFHDIVFNPDI